MIVACVVLAKRVYQQMASLHITKDEPRIVSKELIGEDTYISKSFMALFTIDIGCRIRAGGTRDVDA